MTQLKLFVRGPIFLDRTLNRNENCFQVKYLETRRSRKAIVPTLNAPFAILYSTPGIFSKFRIFASPEVKKIEFSYQISNIMFCFFVIYMLVIPPVDTGV